MIFNPALGAAKSKKVPRVNTDSNNLLYTVKTLQIFKNCCSGQSGAVPIGSNILIEIIQKVEVRTERSLKISLQKNYPRLQPTGVYTIQYIKTLVKL
jgi:hypothetical protein